MSSAHKQQGFSHVLLMVVVVVVLGVAGFALFKVMKSEQNAGTSNSTDADGSNSDGPAPLKNIGFNLGPYDPATQRAGDVLFSQDLARALTSDPIYQKMIWADYGLQDIRSPNDPTKRNVQPTIYLPLGTKVLAPIDGVVVKVEKLYSNDWTIWFGRDKDDTWNYETEHVDNPVVKAGDKVTAGQVVAEVSSFSSKNIPGFGLYELGLFHPENNEPTHHCPFRYMDKSVKAKTQAYLMALYQEWEKYLGTEVYDENSYVMPGCAIDTPAKG
jgi:biotin carboxyl carrier protein